MTLPMQRGSLVLILSRHYSVWLVLYRYIWSNSFLHCNEITHIYLQRWRQALRNVKCNHDAVATYFHYCIGLLVIAYFRCCLINNCETTTPKFRRPWSRPICLSALGTSMLLVWNGLRSISKWRMPGATALILNRWITCKTASRFKAVIFRHFLLPHETTQRCMTRPMYERPVTPISN